MPEPMSDMPFAYPVLIKITEYRLVWVEADSIEDAESYVNDDSEYIGTVEPYDVDWSARTPKDRWDWKNLYSPVGPAPRNDAHVEAHRRHVHAEELKRRRAVHAAAGHPDQERSPVHDDGSKWCMACGEYFTVTDAGAPVGGGDRD